MTTRTKDYMQSVNTLEHGPSLLLQAPGAVLYRVGDTHLVLAVNELCRDATAVAYVSRAIPTEWVCWATDGDETFEFQHFGPPENGDN